MAHSGEVKSPIPEPRLVRVSERRRGGRVEAASVAGAIAGRAYAEIGGPREKKNILVSYNKRSHQISPRSIPSAFQSHKTARILGNSAENHFVPIPKKRVSHTEPP